MRRRDFLAAIGASAGWSIEAQAQQGNRIRLIGAFFERRWSDPPDWQAHADGIVSISKLKEGDTDTNTLMMRFDRGAGCVWNTRRFGIDQGLRPWTPAVKGIRIKGSASSPPGSRRCGSGRQRCP